MMFGTDEIIQSVAPGYKFDALLRRRDKDRYDDREIVRTNLIDAFDLLMTFIEKHLNDPFYLEGTISVSLRTRIFRELVANIIAHREYTSAAPATLTIYEDRVELMNPNVPHYHGRIDPARFTPYPKNPTICKFLMQLGRYEELGSGINNVTKYLPLYAPGAGAPSFSDDDMFTTIVPRASGEVTAPLTAPVTAPVQKLLGLLETEGDLSNVGILELLSLKSRRRMRENYITPALNSGLIEYTIPDKPSSSKQRYRLTKKGKEVMDEKKRGMG